MKKLIVFLFPLYLLIVIVYLSSGDSLLRVYLTDLGTITTAFAMIYVALFTFETNRSNDLRETKDKEFRQQLSDLYQAIIIATAIGGPHDTSKVLKKFRELYKGKTPIHLIFKQSDLNSSQNLR